jgi:lipopolysaccharide biosynthesis protein
LNPIQYIAFYLPQFHAIPENDAWWGKGFTEWTNVKKAKPLFKGHYQPHIPTELGYYDLVNSDVRIQQAQLASAYGINGFCYWHYWFGNGRQLLQKPAQLFLESKEPDFPICFAWANQTWSGIWHGLENKILAEQVYAGEEDDRKHFYTMLPFFTDKRYIRKDDKPVFILYRPFDHPYLDSFIEHWQELAIKNGLKGIYFLGISYQRTHCFKNLDGLIYHDSYWRGSINIFDKAFKKIVNEYPDEWFSKLKYGCHKLSYEALIKRIGNEVLSDDMYPTIYTGWDNTPRSGRRGKVFYDYTPALLGKQVQKIRNLIDHRSDTFCFIKSWNEWAEGNYLEPEHRYGHAFLEEFKKHS